MAWAVFGEPSVAFGNKKAYFQQLLATALATPPTPTYREVCSGMTGHNEVVLVVFDPNLISYERLLKVFWESHNPTQGMRQGNDVGTQYRSGIYTYSPEQTAAAEKSLVMYQEALNQLAMAPLRLKFWMHLSFTTLRTTISST